MIYLSPNNTFLWFSLPLFHFPIASPTSFTSLSDIFSKHPHSIHKTHIYITSHICTNKKPFPSTIVSRSATPPRYAKICPLARPLPRLTDALNTNTPLPYLTYKRAKRTRAQ